METEREGALSQQKQSVSLEDIVDNVKAGVAPPPKKARTDYAQTRDSASQPVTMHSSVDSVTDHQALPVKRRGCQVKFTLRKREIFISSTFANVCERFVYFVK